MPSEMQSENDTIYAALRRRLVNGEFDPGAKLRPEVLKSELSCSASTVREALFRLSTVGLVEFQEQRGFRLTKQSPKLQHDVTKFRILLESEGATESIRKGGIAWEARLSAAHHRLKHIETFVQGNSPDAETIALWTDAEFDFHRTLIEACGSDVLIRSHEIVYQQFRQQLITRDRDFEFVPENIEQHQGILDAALSHDESLVRQRIYDHLKRNLRPEFE